MPQALSRRVMNIMVPMLCLLPGAARPGTTELKHSWQIEEHGTSFRSTSRAPPPFSMTGEPEATMKVEATRRGPDRPKLEQVIREQVGDIRKDVDLAEYLEEDGRKADRGIATWTQNVAGQKVGFIKYRVAGRAGRRLPAPRTVTHAIAIMGDRIFFFHLFVVFAEHQDEVRADFLRVIEDIVSSKAVR